MGALGQLQLGSCEDSGMKALRHAQKCRLTMCKMRQVMGEGGLGDAGRQTQQCRAERARRAHLEGAICSQR